MTLDFEDWDQRTVPEPALAALIAIHFWSNIMKLPQFAADRHGYGNSDGGFGITYPTDLDDYDREVEKMEIPSGYVLAYGFWGGQDGGYDVLVPEQLYLAVLADALAKRGLATESVAVRALVGDTGVE